MRTTYRFKFNQPIISEMEDKDQLHPALHTAVRSGDISKVIACLKGGADIHAKNTWNAVASSVAWDRGYKEIYNLLIEHAAKTKKEKEEGHG